MVTVFRRIGFIHLLWALPVLFGLHNFEESIGMESFSKTYLERIYTVTEAQFKAALVIITLAGIFTALMAIRYNGRGFWAYAALWLQSILFVNAFTHIAGSVVFSTAAPGVYSAVLINIPYSLWLFALALRDGYVTRRRLGMIFIAGLISYAPVTFTSLLAGLYASRLFV